MLELRLLGEEILESRVGWVSARPDGEPWSPDQPWSFILWSVKCYWVNIEQIADSSVGKEFASDAGDTGDAGSISGSGRCPGEGNGNPLQYSRLENPKDKGAGRSTVHGVTRPSDQTTKAPLVPPGGASGKNLVCQCRQPRREGFDPWVGKIPLEEKMATHSSILTWRIPLTEEPCWLQSKGSQKIRHDWSNLAHRWTKRLS